MIFYVADDKVIPTGALIGIVAGSVVVLALTLVAVLYVKNRYDLKLNCIIE